MKALAGISVVLLAYTVGILVMIFGWGLTPVSWPWIIGGMTFSFLLFVIAEAIKRT